MSLEELVSTLERFETIDLSALSKQDNYDRVRPQALAAVRKLYQHLETPGELSRRLAWQEPAHTAAIRVAKDLKLFELLSKVGPSGSLSSKELAASSNSHEELVGRICRLLAAWGTIREVDEDRYAPTLKSDGLNHPKVYSGIDFWFDMVAAGFTTLPQFLKENEYEKFESATEGNWPKGSGNGAPFFAWLDARPECLRTFANHMVGFQEGRGTWVEMYPTQERLIVGAEAEGTLLVDIGGNFGQDVTRFHEKHPQSAGRLVVQDVSTVIEQARENNTNPAIEFQVHDFNTPQPIKGARAYLLHHILHDWQDDICHTILTQLAGAMKPGYSKVLIGEFVIGSRNPDPVATALDFTVGTFLGSKERTEQAWRKMLGAAGFKLNGIWSLPQANSHSVIEAELA